jgi:ketosteroid isomerase-like protein
MSEVEEHKAVACAFIDAIVRNDVGTVLTLFDESGHVLTMGSTLLSGTVDKKTLGDRIGQVRGAFPNGLAMKVHSVIGEREFVAMEAESHGLLASGKIYNNKFHFLFRFRNQKILELREYMDTEHVTDVLCNGKRP